MHSMWKGTISFGLVMIPVKLYSAAAEHAISAHQVRASDGSRVRQRRVAESDGAEVAYSELARGFDHPSGTTVILTDADLASLPVPTRHTIEVDQFVSESELDPVLFQKTYYLEPDKTGVKPYVLLRDALDESGLVGIVKVAIRQRETMAVLRVREGVFTLTTLLWADEVRAPSFPVLETPVTISAAERKVADQLISSMTTSLDLSAYTDEYTAALQELIDARAGDPVATPVTAQGGGTETVVDLMAALQASVEASRSSRAHHPAGKKRTTAARPRTTAKSA